MKSEHHLPNRRGNAKQSKDFWSLGPDTPETPDSRMNVCFYEYDWKKPDWERVENACQVHNVPIKEHTIDGRKLIYTVIRKNDPDQSAIKNLRHMASECNVQTHQEVAYPSSELAYHIQQALHQAHEYRPLDEWVGNVCEDCPGVYLYRNGDHVYYVGQTYSLSRRVLNHRQDSAPIADYRKWVRCNAPTQDGRNFTNWLLCFIPLANALEFSVQGHIMYDSSSNNSFRNELIRKYKHSLSCKKHTWALDSAERALIAYFRPHFNIDWNTYPSSLDIPEYCPSLCLIHQDAARKNMNKRSDISLLE